MVLPVKFGSQKLSLAVDSGAVVNVLSEESFRQLKRQLRGGKLKLHPTDVTLQGVGKNPLEVLGTVTLGIRLGTDSARINLMFYVISKFNLNADGLIGLRSMTEHQMEIHPPRNLVKIGNRTYPAMEEPCRFLVAHSDAPARTNEQQRRNASENHSIGSISYARLLHTVTVPANMSMTIAVDVPQAFHGNDIVIEGPSKLNSVEVEPTLTTVNNEGQAFALLVNQNNYDVTLQAGKTLSQALVYNAKVQLQPDSDSCVASVQRSASDIDVSPPATLSSFVKVEDYPEHRQTLINLLQRHRPVVALPGEPLGSTTLTEHTIRVKPGTKPVYIPAYRLPHSQRNEVQKQVQEMLAQKVITESNSEWNSPIFIVPKKDGSFRPVIDFRKVNNVTEDDRYPLPVLKDILTSLGKGNIVFSTIDLLSGYWQVPLSADSQKITGFSTPNGHYHFLRMAFGLKGAPITFSRMMNQLFSGMIGNNLFVYLDDVICFNKTIEDHFETLNEVFNRLQQANLKAKLSKCVFLKKNISFLGHRVDSEGIHTADDKINAVKLFPQPKSIENVRSFLGLCGYYRSFVKHFATIASPLTTLLRKNQPFVWGKVQEQSFQQLKNALTTAPILTFPDYNLPFVIYTDASALGVGAVLMQTVKSGKNKVIAYASRVLNQAESNYSVTHQEALAIVWALKTFKDIVFGYNITVYSDHSAVTHLFEGRNLSGRLARWDLTIQEFNPTIKFVPGHANRVADSLSRNPIAAVTDSLTTIDNFSVAELKQKQREHTLWKKVIYQLESGDHVPIDELRVPISQFLLDQDGILCRYWPEKRYASVQMVIPEELVPIVLKLEHDTPVAGHPGKDRTLEALRRKYYWATMRIDTERHINQCIQCATYKGNVRKPAPMLEYPPPSYPMEVIGIDLLTLSPSRQGSRYLLVCVDHLTRYIMLAPLKNKTAEAVAHALVTQVFLKHGTPKVILSDNGLEFKNSVVKEICGQFNVTQAFITPYHPASNGLVERSNRKILEILRPVVGSLLETWEDWLPYVAASINSHVCSATGTTPHYSLYGRELRLPYDMLGSFQPPVYNPLDFGKAQFKTFADIYSDIRHRLQESKTKLAETQHKRADPIILEEGNVVMTLESERHNKLHPKFSGPFIITSRAYGNSFEVLDPEKKTLQIVHADRLKKTHLEVKMTLEEAKAVANEILLQSQSKGLPQRSTNVTHDYNLRSKSQTSY